MATRSSKTQAGVVTRLPRPVLEEWTWQERGRCQNVPSEVFFPEDLARKSRRAQEERAKRICRDCPVLAECRDHAVRTPETYGVWGATTPRERAGWISATQDAAASGN